MARGEGGMTGSSGYLKPGLSFDSAPLQAELGLMLATEWIDHYNTTAYASGWQCIPLRSVDGRLDHVMALDRQAYAPTVILERCPHFQRVLAAFQCKLHSVRLMSLAPGARILPQRDPAPATKSAWRGCTCRCAPNRKCCSVSTTRQCIFRRTTANTVRARSMTTPCWCLGNWWARMLLESLFASALAQAGEHGLILLNYHQMPG